MGYTKFIYSNKEHKYKCKFRSVKQWFTIILQNSKTYRKNNIEQNEQEQSRSKQHQWRQIVHNFVDQEHKPPFHQITTL